MNSNQGSSEKSINLYDHFNAVFLKSPHKIGLSTADNIEYSYEEMHKITAKLANALRELGVRPRDVVAVQVEKSAYNVFLYLACLRSHITYLPLNPQYTADEIQFFLKDAKPKLVVCCPLKKDILQTLNHNNTWKLETLDAQGLGTLYTLSQKQSELFEVQIQEYNEVAVLLYTSGTTGKPKGAILSHNALLENALSINTVWEINSQDTVLHVLPLFHVHGLFFALHTAILAGARLLMLPKFEVQSVIEALSKVTIVMGIPTYYSRLMTHKNCNKRLFKHVRLLISGSAPLSMQTFSEFKKVTDHTLLERYGMTETGIISSNPLHGERKPGTVGLPLPGVSIRIVDMDNKTLDTGLVGYIQVKGSHLFNGYLNMHQQTKEDFTQDGYFKTGDMGVIDDAGYLSIVGREKDLIISGGLNVYPKEVELVIEEMVGVVESAVFGVPHRDYVEAVVAVVILKDNQDGITEQSMIQNLKLHLASFKVPKKIFFERALPKNAMGKVQKNILKAQYRACFL